MTKSRGIGKGRGGNRRQKTGQCIVAGCPNPDHARGLCGAHYAKERYQQNPGYWRKGFLRSRWGLSLEDYTSMFEAQGGRCAICGDPPGRMALAVDHNHDTGQIRGLLCSACNTGIGGLKDRLETVLAAAEYLRRFE